MTSQAELVKMMGVSRISLREAIRSLEGQGLLQVENGQGVYVGENFQPGIMQITLSFHKKKENYLETLEVRERNYQKALRANTAIIANSRKELMSAPLRTEK